MRAGPSIWPKLGNFGGLPKTQEVFAALEEMTNFRYGK